MTERSNVFSPQEFVERLRRDELAAPLTLTGMVKEAPDNSTHLLFAFGARCESWTSIPLDLIDKIELVDQLTCRDHSHPLVNVILKKQQSPEAVVLVSLLQASLIQRTPVSPAPPLPSMAGVQQNPVGSASHFPQASGAQQRRQLIPFARYARPGNAGSHPIARSACSECNEYEIVDELGIGSLHHCNYYPGGTVLCWYEYSV